jgi:hypothetical protein
VSARFSTTTLVEAAAFDVCLMDTFQGYFEYEMQCGCGIPEVTVLGTPEDWGSMIQRVRHLSEFGLERWSDVLTPVLNKVADTAAGKIDAEFWRSFFRYQSGSGPAELTGWILTLFPYLMSDPQTGELMPNDYLSTWNERFQVAEKRGKGFLSFGNQQGPSIGEIPSSLVSAPVHYIDLSTGAEHALRFVAGMFGVEQSVETRALAPAFGWAVVYDSEP